jgi:AbrB family looped-hinge helix DNA binding protein
MYTFYNCAHDAVGFVGERRPPIVLRAPPSHSPVNPCQQGGFVLGFAWIEPIGPSQSERRGLIRRITVVLCTAMSLPQSKLTAQGQISVPAEIRRRLGVGPGSILEWDEHGEDVVVRRAGRFSSEDIHRAMFAKRPRTRKLEDLKDAVRRHLREKHARR